jgi:hypothetical protein
MMSSKDKDKVDNIENMYKDNIKSILIGKEIFLLIKIKKNLKSKYFLIIETFIISGITQYQFTIFICLHGTNDNINILKSSLIIWVNGSKT